MNKRCKQCTRVLPDTEEYFRPYTPRGKGIRKTTVGRNTVCRECEHLNNTATRIWKQGPKTEQEQELLDKLPAYYKVLVAKGGHPIGAYANHVLKREPNRHPSSTSALDNLLNSITTVIEAGDPLMEEYDRLLALELTEEPDVYQDLLDKVREQSLGADGRVTDKYRDKFIAVATRFDEYEDNYQWD